MRAMLIRQRMVRSAAAAASVALLAACGAKAGVNPATNPSASGPPGPAYAAGTLAVSNGTNVVEIAGQKVTFPTTVTDAAWSPDGSRLAFVDADGNIASAHPDGTGLLVLTKKIDGVVRSRPSWNVIDVDFVEQKGNEKPNIMTARNDAGDAAHPLEEYEAYIGEENDDSGGANEAAPSDTGTTSDGKEMAFQRQGSKGPEIWVADRNQRDTFATKLADGSEPAIAPDGSKVAYVDSAGRVEVVDVLTTKAKPVPVTFGVVSPKHLAWSPDATALAFQTAAGIESVSTSVAAGATDNPVKQLSSVSGVPTFLRPGRDRLTTISGADPVQMSITASASRWPTLVTSSDDPYGQQARAAVLASTANLATMLAGAQVVDNGPLLFTTGSGLDPRTKTELTRVLGKPVKGIVPVVTILGGTDDISAAAETAVRALGYKTDRIAAQDPASMALTAAGKPTDTRTVFVVDAADTGAYLAAISTLGAGSDQTVLLTNGSVVPDGVKAFLNGVTKDAKVYAVGATAQAALKNSWSGRPASLVVTPYVGATSGATVAVLLNTNASHERSVVLVNSASQSDIIVAIGLARPYGAPVLLLDPKAALDPGIAAWLDKSSTAIDNLMIVDSSGAIGADVQAKVGRLVCGPLGYATTANPKTTATAPATG